MENINAGIQKISQTLIKEDLNNPLIGIYLNNLFLLKNFLVQFENLYTNTCEDLAEGLEELIRSATKFILTNEFIHVCRNSSYSITIFIYS